MKELILKATGGVMPSIIANESSAGAVIVPSQPMDIRAHCAGSDIRFSIGGNTNEGTTLEFHIFDFMEQKGIRPSEQYETPSDFTQFVGLATIGSKKVLSTLTFGSTSAQEASDLIPLLELKSETGLNALEFIVSVTLEPVTNKKKQKYAIAKFKFREATQEEMQKAIDAYNTNPVACQKFRPLPNVDEA